MNKYKIAVLATGGMDSIALAYLLKKNKPDHLQCLITINYGQTAFKKELQCLELHSSKLNVPLVILNHKFVVAEPGLFIPGYKLKEEMSPDGVDTKTDEMKYKEIFIEGRNAMIVLTAMTYCSAMKIDELQCGFVNNQGTWDNQRSTFKLFTNDSSPHFVDAINLLALTGLSHYVRFTAPFLNLRLDKTEVFNLARKLDIDVEKDTYSCYFDEPCGTCLSCKTKNTLLEQERQDYALLDKILGDSR